MLTEGERAELEQRNAVIPPVFVTDATGKVIDTIGGYIEREEHLVTVSRYEALVALLEASEALYGQIWSLPHENTMACLALPGWEQFRYAIKAARE